MPKTIQLNSLPDGIFTVKGKLAYSRLAKPIAGDELLADQKRRAQQGRPMIARPYTTATVYDAQVLYAATPDMAKYADEHFFTSVSNPKGHSFSGVNKGNYVPRVGWSLNGGKDTKELKLSDKELARDLDVILVMRVFTPKNNMNKGLSLDAVIVLGEPKFYGNTRDDALAKAGITFTSPDDEQPEPAMPNETVPPVNQGVPVQQTPFAPQSTPFTSPAGGVQQGNNNFQNAGITFNP